MTEERAAATDAAGGSSGGGYSSHGWRPAIEISHRARMEVLGAVLLALLLGALDQTIVGTALPTIVTDLHGNDLYTWVVTIYLLTSTISVPFYGKLSDIFEQWLDRKKPHCGGRSLKIRYSRYPIPAVLYRNAPPDVTLACYLAQRAAKHVPQTHRSFRQDLVGVPPRQMHRGGHAGNVGIWHLIVKQVTH